MMNLWTENSPNRFWLCEPEPAAELWQVAAQEANPVLALVKDNNDIEMTLELTLGEGQFGPGHWTFSASKRLYYALKPILPRQAIKMIKKANARSLQHTFPLGWPVERRYAEFQWEVMRRLLANSGQSTALFSPLWPEKKRFSFVLTHDIESAEGQQVVPAIAELEQSLGFRSSFNFVPENYPLDFRIMQELRDSGFEIGVHGLRHDGKLFSSRNTFMERAKCINHYLKLFDAVGFRAPLMHRHPEWLQALDIEYDLSFFDTDPYEPIPGGSMSIWPYVLGRFVELPYTLVQDSTLYQTLGETTPSIWLEKADFIEQYHGMVLLNTHPDYLLDPKLLGIYTEFLQTMKQKRGMWHALPREVARWWQKRPAVSSECQANGEELGRITLENGRIEVDWCD